MNEVVALFLGAFIAGVVGILTNRVSRYLEERNIKKRVWRTLKAEIIANQFILAPFYFQDPEEWGNIPRSLSFDRVIYTELAENISLLKNMPEVVDYYMGIKSVETLYMKIGDETRKRLSQISSKKELEGFFESTAVDKSFVPLIEATYELGEELKMS